MSVCGRGRQPGGDEPGVYVPYELNERCRTLRSGIAHHGPGVRRRARGHCGQGRSTGRRGNTPGPVVHDDHVQRDLPDGSPASARSPSTRPTSRRWEPGCTDVFTAPRTYEERPMCRRSVVPLSRVERAVATGRAARELPDDHPSAQAEQVDPDEVGLRPQRLGHTPHLVQALRSRGWRDAAAMTSGQRAAASLSGRKPLQCRRAAIRERAAHQHAPTAHVHDEGNVDKTSIAKARKRWWSTVSARGGR